MSGDDEQKVDAMGAVPTPMNGGSSMWLQFGTNAASVRASYCSSFGLNSIKGLRPVMNSVLYQGLFLLEGDARVKEIEDKEEARGIFRAERTRSGKKEIIVYMSKDDKTNKVNAQTLQDTLNQRSAFIGIPSAVLEKVDKYAATWLDMKTVAMDLHNTPVSDYNLTTFPVFEALQARGEQRKKESDTEDVNQLKMLRDEGKAAMMVCEERLGKLTPLSKELPKEIEGLHGANARLDVLIKQKMQVGQEEEAIDDMVARRSNRIAIEEKSAQWGSINETIENVTKEKKDLEKSIAEYEEKINNNGRAPKRQRAS